MKYTSSAERMDAAVDAVVNEVPTVSATSKARILESIIRQQRSLSPPVSVEGRLHGIKPQKNVSFIRKFLVWCNVHAESSKLESMIT